jgi:hypothetical protein
MSHRCLFDNQNEFAARVTDVEGKMMICQLSQEEADLNNEEDTAP